jgi:hypothetical protein
MAHAAVLPVVPSGAQAQPEVAIVESVRGLVQRSTGQKWEPLAPGDRLGANESLRTGVNGGTALRIGDKSRLNVDPSSQLVIRELTATLHRFKLTRGHVGVEYQPDAQRVLRIEGSDDDSAAVTHGARFSVLSTGRAIAIATAEGSVDLQSHGEKVQVAAGRQAVAEEGKKPTAPQPMSTELWLKVANALAQAPEGICGSLQGTAPRGAEVSVEGKPVDVAADGTFSVRVPRTPGKTEVVVAIRDAAGRTTSRRIACSEEQGSADDVALHWGKGGGQ